MSFESEKPFNDYQHFARGIRRSGDFTINESALLEKYGAAMMELYKGTRKPKDKDEKTFVKQITGDEIITDRNAKIFKKYLQVIKPRHLHRLCSVGNDDDLSNNFMGGGSSSSDDSNID
ncbi:MAG TPA: hypothetical protein DCR21_02070 [Succinivibrionaceae bacterium]|nr:DUF413 domain-containing protein [Succinivibrio sp.]HAR79594.1 hypothetical protein [Succinivibrionaceae bacterium]